MEDIETIAPSKGTENSTKDTQTKSDESWKSLTGDKFKSEAELAKAYKELESKFGQQSEDIRKGREFAETVAPVLDIIKNDPEAFKLIDEKLRAVTDPPKDQKPKDAKKKDEELRSVASDILIKNFEAQHGFTDLSPEEQKGLRQKMGSLVAEMTGQSLADVDLRRLGTALENAYIIATHNDKRTDSDEDTIPNGAISSIPSSKGKGQEKLSAEEVTVASKLGLTREQYLSGKKVK
jgi:hypothetical protein